MCPNHRACGGSRSTLTEEASPCFAPSPFWFPSSLSSSLGFYRNGKISCLVYCRLPLSVSDLFYILTCEISLLASICSLLFTVLSFGAISVQSRSPFTHVVCHSRLPYIYQHSHGSLFPTPNSACSAAYMTICDLPPYTPAPACIGPG
jgi:hypothetical protein